MSALKTVKCSNAVAGAFSLDDPAALSARGLEWHADRRDVLVGSFDALRAFADECTDRASGGYDVTPGEARACRSMSARIRKALEIWGEK